MGNEEPKHRTILTNGVRLHAVVAGPEDGPLAVLLHGFPELWYGWRHQIAPLEEADRVSRLLVEFFSPPVNPQPAR